MMTPKSAEEVAEKIALPLLAYSPSAKALKEFKSMCVLLIESALAEARREQIKKTLKLIPCSYGAGHTECHQCKMCLLAKAVRVQLGPAK